MSEEKRILYTLDESGRNIVPTSLVSKAEDIVVGASGKPLTEALNEAISGSIQNPILLDRDNADMNDVITPGFYYCNSNEKVATFRNIPHIQKSFSMIVTKTTTTLTSINQILIYYRHSAATVWVRQGYGDSWTDWKQIMTNDVLPEFAAAKLKHSNVTIDYLNNFKNNKNYEVTTNLGKELGLSTTVNNWIHLKHFGHGPDGYAMQMAFNLNNQTAGSEDHWYMKIRSSGTTKWNPWRDILTTITEPTHNVDYGDIDVSLNFNNVKGVLNVKFGKYGSVANSPQPSDNGYVIPLFKQNNDVGVQLYLSHNHDVIYIRRFRDTVWHPWRLVWNPNIFELEANQVIVKKPLKVSDIGGIGPTGSNITLNGTNDKLVSFRKKDGGDLISLQDLEKYRIDVYDKVNPLTFEIANNPSYNRNYVGIIDFGQRLGLPHNYTNITYQFHDGNGWGMQMAYMNDSVNSHIRIFTRRARLKVWDPWDEMVTTDNIGLLGVKKLGPVTTNQSGILDMLASPAHLHNYECTVHLLNEDRLGLDTRAIWVHIKYQSHGGDGWAIQIATNMTGHDQNFENNWYQKIRYSSGAIWQPWLSIPMSFVDNNTHAGAHTIGMTYNADLVRGTLNVRAGRFQQTLNRPIDADDGYYIPFFHTNAQWGVQMYLSHNYDRIILRRMHDRQWQPWVCVADGGSFGYDQGHFYGKTSGNFIKTRHFEGDCPGQDGSMFLNYYNGKPVYFKHTDGTVHSIQEVFQLAVDGKNTIINGINTALGYNSGLNTGHTWNDLNWWMLYKAGRVINTGYDRIILWLPNEFSLTQDVRDGVNMYNITNNCYTRSLDIDISKLKMVIPFSIPYYLKWENPNGNESNAFKYIHGTLQYNSNMNIFNNYYSYSISHGYTKHGLLDNIYCTQYIKPNGENVYRIIVSKGNGNPRPNLWDWVSFFIVILNN